MVRGLQGEEWKFIQKYLKEKISCGVGRNRGKFARWSSNFAPWFEVCEILAQWTEEFAPCTVVCEIVPQLDAVVFRRPYLSHFSSKSYMVWSVGFLTSWALKWYIEYRKWTSGSAPKVLKKTAAAVLCFPPLHCSFLAYFERLWQRAMELQSLVLHEFELPKALP